MEIFPENLGTPLEAEVLRERAGEFGEAPPFPLPNTIGIGFLACLLLTVLLWLIAATGLAIISTLATISLLVWYCNQALAYDPVASQVYLKGYSARVPQSPLTTYEIQNQQRFRQDSLLKTYLDLATSITMAATPDAEAEHEVRNALQALGTTVLALPADDPKTASDDPTALRAEAAKLENEVQSEPDAVIRASLHRRAESLTRRADTAARTLLLLRRNQALRQETGEQMDALRTSLTAFRVGGRQSAPELAELAASIQRVAQEANAITAARAEVDTILTRTVVNATVPPVNEAQPQPVLR